MYDHFYGLIESSALGDMGHSSSGVQHKEDELQREWPGGLQEAGTPLIWPHSPFTCSQGRVEGMDEDHISGRLVSHSLPSLCSSLSHTQAQAPLTSPCTSARSKGCRECEESLAMGCWLLHGGRIELVPTSTRGPTTTARNTVTHGRLTWAHLPYWSTASQQGQLVKVGVNGPDEREKGDGNAAGAVNDDACRDGALEAAQTLCLCAAQGAHAHQQPEWAPFAQHWGKGPVWTDGDIHT